MGQYLRIPIFRTLTGRGNTFALTNIRHLRIKTDIQELYGRGTAFILCILYISIYQENHPKWCKELIKDAIKLLLPDPVLECQGPSTLIATLNRQKKEQRDVLHLLHYIPVKVSKDLYTIEDVIPLYQVPCKIRIEEKVVSVKTVPEGEGINFSQQGNLVEFTVPRIQGHRMVEISYQNK